MLMRQIIRDITCVSETSDMTSLISKKIYDMLMWQIISKIMCGIDYYCLLEYLFCIFQRKLVKVFSETADVPQHEFLIFSTAVTLKFRSRSLTSNQFFVMSQLYIHENFERINPLDHKILCSEESTTPTPTPIASTPKTICPPPLRWRAHNKTWHFMWIEADNSHEMPSLIFTEKR